MKILVLGGAGLQGKAALHDLSRSPHVKKVVCADITFEPVKEFERFLDMNKIKLQEVDVKDGKGLVSLMKNGFDVVIDVLPVAFIGNVTEAALEAQVVW
jgi:saccharopine dehydrogenase-like NADP-dependent oxidoreductase